jgi:type IV secretion system T-DNA border endonuclease VirD1
MVLYDYVVGLFICKKGRLMDTNMRSEDINETPQVGATIYSVRSVPKKAQKAVKAEQTQDSIPDIKIESVRAALDSDRINQVQKFLFQLAPIPFKRPNKNEIKLTGYKVVSVRLREPEFLCFSEQVSEAGLTNNQALRIAARKIAGFLETSQGERDTLKEISANLAAIGQNLSRMNRLAANGGTINMSELACEREAFGKSAAHLEDKLKIILNVSQRRQDGMSMLKKAAQ